MCHEQARRSMPEDWPGFKSKIGFTQTLDGEILLSE